MEGIQEATAEAASSAISRAGFTPAAASVEKKRDNKQDDEEFVKDKRGHSFRTSSGSPAKKGRVDLGEDTGPNATGAGCCTFAVAAIAFFDAGCASSSSAVGLEQQQQQPPFEFSPALTFPPMDAPQGGDESTFQLKTDIRVDITLAMASFGEVLSSRLERMITQQLSSLRREQSDQGKALRALQHRMQDKLPNQEALRAQVVVDLHVRPPSQTPTRTTQEEF